MYCICIFCGSRKRVPFKKCRRCGQAPEGVDIEMAKSLVLSTVLKGEDGKPFKTKEELKQIGENISSGREYFYHDATLKSLLEEKSLIDESPVPWWRVALFILCFMSIPIIAVIVFLMES